MSGIERGDFARQNFITPVYGPRKPRRTFVLLFDGTGNKFSGEDGDSNVLKILRMLDRSDSSQVHYYQPGIGTYVHSNTYSHTSVFTRFNSWLQKARDSAIGTSFDVHVMGGYKFLMKYYETGDDIYFFGFSRGAYIARFLAEMLDYVGLLEPGNEEMARFAWKAFAQWQMRLDGTDEEKEKKRKMFKYLSAFRDTFSRPVRRIRFLGLFDTVNSVPRFENAWMQRSKFPYTAKSSAIVIRHAVGIDERRAKFRQDLIGQEKTHDKVVTRGRPLDNTVADVADHLHVPQKQQPSVQPHDDSVPANQRYRRKSRAHHSRSLMNAQRDASPARSIGAISEGPELEGTEGGSLRTASSNPSLRPVRRHTGDLEEDEDDADEAIPQDLQEIWFPGCHADIGGGWPLAKGEDLPLSHAPLVWMVREARKAGLAFDEEKMIEMRCLDPDDPSGDGTGAGVPGGYGSAPPAIHIEAPTTPGAADVPAAATPAVPPPGPASTLQRHIHSAATRGVMHDCLEYGQGLPPTGVIAWKLMEYLPFRRMDLLPDSSWQSIRWPLPKGEVRDVPRDAIIHTSALRRMEANVTYRPGNIIVGGGGRGVRRAPERYGLGEWEVVREAGDPVGECVVRRVRASEEVKERQAEEKTRRREEKEKREKEKKEEGKKAHEAQKNGSIAKKLG